jgi:hypothetical protein
MAAYWRWRAPPASRLDGPILSAGDARLLPSFDVPRLPGEAGLENALHADPLTGLAGPG